MTSAATKAKDDPRETPAGFGEAVRVSTPSLHERVSMSGTAPMRLMGETLLLDPSGCLYLPDHETLVVSDLHLEKGSSFAIRRRSMLPPYDTVETLTRLAASVSHWRPKRIVSLGDSFHDGEGAGRMDGADRGALLSIMEGRDWIWIAGNHDPAPPADLPGTCRETLSIGPLTLRHEPKTGRAGRGEIAGHLHPGARVSTGGGHLRGPCFASDGNRLIMPAFGAYAGCLNVLDEAFEALFGWDRFCAYMTGRRRTFCIARRHLVADRRSNAPKVGTFAGRALSGRR